MSGYNSSVRCVRCLCEANVTYYWDIGLVKTGAYYLFLLNYSYYRDQTDIRV
jgi:hypothetical protein